MNNFKKTKIVLSEGKKDYEIYHKTYSESIAEIITFIEKNGYTYDDNDYFHNVSIGGKPKVGQTKRIHLTLFKNGKEQRKGLQAQVYGMDSGRFELNMYIL